MLEKLEVCRKNLLFDDFIKGVLKHNLDLGNATVFKDYLLVLASARLLQLPADDIKPFSEDVKDTLSEAVLNQSNTSSSLWFDIHYMEAIKIVLADKVTVDFSTGIYTAEFNEPKAYNQVSKLPITKEF